MNLKTLYLIAVGILGTSFSVFFGEYTYALGTLLILMCVDILTGGIIIPLFYKKSPKTQSGGIQSSAFGKGITRKFYRILLIGVAYRFQTTIGISYLKDGLIVSFIFEEMISILENGTIMGVPMPKILTEALDVVKNKTIKFGKE